MTEDHKNNTEPHEGLGKFYRDTIKILRHPTFPRPSTKKNSSFYLCVQAAHFMERRTGFLVELALQNIHKLDSFLFRKIPHFDVIQEIYMRYHL